MGSVFVSRLLNGRDRLHPFRLLLLPMQSPANDEEQNCHIRAASAPAEAGCAARSAAAVRQQQRGTLPQRA